MNQLILAGWTRVRGQLRAQVGESTYKNWLKPLDLVDYEDGTVTLSLPTTFMRDWVASHFGKQLTALWEADVSPVRSVSIIVLPDSPLSEGSNRPTGQVMPAPESPAAPSQPTGLEVSGAILPQYSFENYVVGAPNEFAYAAARRVSEFPAQDYNPLFLYGKYGLGKTHLMHAIALQISAKKPDKKIVYLSAERFVTLFVSALKSRDVVTFKDRLRSVDVLLLDDLQFINGKGATQEEIFHTLNDLTDSRRQVVFSADRAPSELKGVDERLISRLGSGLVADLKDTTYELRLAILKAKVNSRGVTISPAVQDFLAHKMTSSVRALEGALIRVVAHMDLVGRQITVESCKDVLRDVLRAKDRPVTIEEIQRQVAEHYNIHMSDMYSPRRARAVARPRQVAMYLSKRLTARSLPEIGRKFGGRDHTTVLHAMRKIDALRAEDASFAQDIERLKQILEH